MATSIKKCTRADLPQLEEISRVTFTDTFGQYNSQANLEKYLVRSYSQPQLHSELTNPDSEFFFIFEGDELAGYLKINILDAQTEKMGEASLEVQRIYVLPAHKRHGLGRKLMAQAITRAKDCGKTNIWLGVWEHNHGAIAFYEQLGFKKIGDHVFTLGDSPQRDLILKKTI